MQEFIYGLSSTLVLPALLFCMLLTMEIGFRVGRRKQASATEAMKSQSNLALASSLGLLALFLGFTFSLALGRYDDRSHAVVLEANTIETAYLRAQLLPKEVDSEVQGLLSQYLDTRIQEAHLSLADTAERESLLQQANLLTTQLWAHAVKAAALDDSPVRSGLFIQSLNDVFDAYTVRNAALDQHVPEIVILLMFVTLLLTTAAIGHATGLSGHRVTPAALVLVVLIAVVAYLIIDLDKPRRGAIQVNHESLLSLQQTIRARQAGVDQLIKPPSQNQK